MASKTSSKKADVKGSRLISFKRKRSSSTFKGVLFVKRQGKWRAQFCFDKRKIYLGSFNTEIEAAIARDKALRNIFPKKQQLYNFPELQKASTQNEVLEIADKILKKQYLANGLSALQGLDFSIDSFDFSHINWSDCTFHQLKYSGLE